MTAPPLTMMSPTARASSVPALARSCVPSMVSAASGVSASPRYSTAPGACATTGTARLPGLLIASVPLVAIVRSGWTLVPRGSALSARSPRYGVANDRAAPPTSKRPLPSTNTPFVAVTPTLRSKP